MEGAGEAEGKGESPLLNVTPAGVAAGLRTLAIQVEMGSPECRLCREVV